jgi:hypothetical protein
VAVPISPAMVKILISAAAFQAIAATLPGNVAVEPERAPDGSIGIWLDRRIVDRLNQLREPHEGLSDKIQRLK